MSVVSALERWGQPALWSEFENNLSYENLSPTNKTKANNEQMELNLVHLLQS